MKPSDAQKVLDAIVKQIAGFDNPLTLEQCKEKFAYDVDLPVEVHDATTGEPTWTGVMNAGKYMTLKNVNEQARKTDWMLPKRELATVHDILSAWNQVNHTTTERQIDSLHVGESDTIYFCENVFRSQDVTRCKNVLFCNGVNTSEYLIASRRSGGSTNCIRLEDSAECSNSFGVVWSKDIVNCLFIQDSSNMYECMFCSKLRDKKFCIANMQFEEADYYRIKEMVLRWLFSA